jgi:hypothetical protein
VVVAVAVAVVATLEALALMEEYREIQAVQVGHQDLAVQVVMVLVAAVVVVVVGMVWDRLDLLAELVGLVALHQAPLLMVRLVLQGRVVLVRVLVAVAVVEDKETAALVATMVAMVVL